MRVPGGARAPSIVFLAFFLSGSPFTKCRKGNYPFETAAALQQTLAAKPVMSVKPAVWADVRDFYKRRNGAPVWARRSYTRQADEALQELGTAWRHGLKAADYGEQQVLELRGALEQPDRTAQDRAKQLARFDVTLTTALLALGRDVALGRTTPERIDPRWKPRRHQNLVDTLNSSVDGDVKEWLEMVRPPDPQY